MSRNIRSRSRHSARKQTLTLNLAVLAALAATPVLANTQTSTWTNGFGDSNWNSAGNWSPSGVPNNGSNGFTDYNVIIGAPSPLNLNIAPTIDNLTLNTGGALNILGGETLTIDDTISNSTTITVNSGATFTATALVIDNGTISGSGVIALNDDANSNTAALNGTLTQGSAHTIQGEGQINAALVNNGTINANISGHVLTLATNGETNDGTLEATGGGDLNISAITVTQSGVGQVSAGTGSFVNFIGATVSGGTFATSGTGVVEVPSADTGTLASAANSGVFYVVAGGTLDVTGNLLDNGTITINSNKVTSATALNFNGGTVSGNGLILLNDDAAATTAAINGTLTQAAGHTIEGQGQINAALINNGTINANVSGHVLTLATSAETNGNTLEATGGGDLNISAITITQTGTGQISAGTASVVNLNGATVSGGTFTTSGTGVIEIPSSNTGTLAGAANTGVFNILNGGTLDVTGNLANSGTITVNTTGTFSATAINFSGGTLSGNGVIILNDDASGTTAALSGTLTQSSGHTIRGQGQINALLVNNGTVNANVSGHAITLATNGETNNNVLEATGGGDLTLSAITVTQSGVGQITAGTASFVNLNNATVSAGTVTTSGTGVIEALSGEGGTLAGAANAGVFNILGGGSLNITGNFANSGTITLNSNAAFDATPLSFNGGTLSGNGLILLNDDAATTTAAINGSLTQNAGHTIQGDGQINAAFTNGGTVNADVSGHAISLATNNETNNNVLEASGGGDLTISGITVTQSGTGQISAGTASVVNIINGTISGGTLATSGTGVVELPASDVGTLSGVTNTGVLNVLNGGILDVTGNLADSGTITINSNKMFSATSMSVSGGTISGSGAIVLNDDASTTTAAINGSLTQGASHTIQGDGEINAALTNYGLVEGNVVAHGIAAVGTVTNNGLLKATSGGTLTVAASELTNLSAGVLTGGSYEADAASTLTLSGAVTTNNATITLNGAGASIPSISGLVTNEGTFNVLGGAVFTTAGALANSGTVAVGGGSTLTISTTYTQSADLTTIGGLMKCTGTLTANAGLVQLTPHADSAALIASAIKLGASATLDVTNRGIVIPYSGASPIGELTPNGHTQTYPVNSIQGYIQAASDGGSWDNPGLTSSTAQNDPFGLTAVGALDQVDLSNAEGQTYTGSTWMGISITSDHTVLVRETYYGDTDLDGTVGSADVNNLELGYAGFGDGWVYGDFNYDGVVDSQDVNLLDLNYANVPLGDVGLLTKGQAEWLLATENGLTSAQVAAFEERAGVPEPASIGLLGAAAIGLLGRRRREL